ncbi:hypothetical protein WI36_24105 [Burkholderia ubonensis]|uniref:hypothetical protein n=1 Tax=Burkholderia ubonensis TaxID=101571 RepID=UPI00075522A2|nr:hypothetical protein [Burkholderia ubonensis]KUZ66853.1 hypothetical protein WI36_24105 [Burkholderia ubonensis]
MNRPNLAALSKETLVNMYRTVIGNPGDYARRPKSFYLGSLEARGSAELAAAFEANKPKPRKVPQAVLDRRAATANAKELHAIARALVSWGPDLANNPAAITTLQQRAAKAIGSPS